jgi:nitrogen fixation/metabolism regulation signal transduction histidine kinase
MEDHGGELELTDAEGGQGARAILRLPATASINAAARAAVEA